METDFVFMLHENYEITTKKGVIGYQIEVDPVFREQGFFIAVSWIKVIFGPFDKIGNMFYDDANLDFIRLVGEENSLPIAVPALCPWRFKVRNHPELDEVVKDEQLLHGIYMREIPELVPFGDRVFREMHSIRLGDEAYLALRTRLLDINRAQT